MKIIPCGNPLTESDVIIRTFIAKNAFIIEDIDMWGIRCLIQIGNFVIGITQNEMRAALLSNLLQHLNRLVAIRRDLQEVDLTTPLLD